MTDVEFVGLSRLRSRLLRGTPAKTTLGPHSECADHSDVLLVRWLTCFVRVCGPVSTKRICMATECTAIEQHAVVRLPRARSSISSMLQTRSAVVDALVGLGIPLVKLCVLPCACDDSCDLHRKRLTLLPRHEGGRRLATRSRRGTRRQLRSKEKRRHHDVLIRAGIPLIA